MPPCPAGHISTEPDYCSRCGIAIGAQGPAPSGQNLVRQGDLPSSTRLGASATPHRYQVSKRLGQGGFGTAYLAVDLELGRPCVVKELLPAEIGGAFTADEREAMFVSEARMLATLQHPSLPSVSDYFTWDSRHYMVMSFEEGQPLTEVAAAAAGRVPEAEAIRIATDVGMVLGYLHDQPRPIVHRDISPDNIIRRPDGTYVLLDFGAARFFQTGQSKDTVAIGKQGYASPEVANGKAQSDGRSDLYSLGAVLYKACANYDPTTNPFSFPVLTEGSGLSAGFRALMARLVEPSRERRMQSAQELVLTLQGLTSAQPTCIGCGKTLAEGTWRCSCGISQLPPSAWRTVGGDGAHSSRARDILAKRSVVWSVDTSESVVGGPVGMDGTAVLAGAGGTILGVQVDSGRQKWMLSTRLTTRLEMGQPALVGNTAVVPVGDQLWTVTLSGAVSSTLTLGAPGPFFLTPVSQLLQIVSGSGGRWEVDQRTQALTRRGDLAVEVKHGPACIGDRVMFVGTSGDVVCCLARSDKVLWRTRLNISTTGAPVIAGRLLVVAGVAGVVVGVDIDSGTVVGECAVSDQIFATPCIAGQTLVVLGRSALSVVDVLLWRVVARHQLPAAPRAATPVLVGSQLVFADLARGKMWSANAETGTVTPLGELGSETLGWAACIDGWILIGSRSGRLVGIGPS
jgi:serine/threonine protein kinase/outer membrane protein assembly factor BamB